MKHWRPLLACASGLLALLLVNLEIVAKERILSNGKRVLLELRPVDPRALIQGDYMRLAFHRRIYPSSQQKKNLRPRGTVIFRLDKNLVAQFDQGNRKTARRPDQLKIKYKLKKRGNRFSSVRYTANSFFFQEGHGQAFEAAKYAIIHVDQDGNAVLSGLANHKFQTIRP